MGGFEEESRGYQADPKGDSGSAGPAKHCLLPFLLFMAHPSSKSSLGHVGGSPAGTNSSQTLPVTFAQPQGPNGHFQALVDEI